MTQTSLGQLYGRTYEIQIAAGTPATPNAPIKFSSAIVYGNLRPNMATIRLNFDVVQKSNDQTKAQFQLLNLPTRLRNNIQLNSIVRLYAGYPTQYGLLVCGYVTECVSKRQGADVVTTIKTQGAPDGISFGNFKKTYKGLTTRSQVLQNILYAAQVRLNTSGGSTVVSLRAGVYEGLEEKTYANGITFNHTVLDAIKMLFGLNYDVGLTMEGELSITKHGAQTEGLRRVAVILNEQTGLIGTPSLKQSASIAQKTGSTITTGDYIQFTSLLNTRLRAGYYVRLTFENKTYDLRIEMAKFTGGTDDGAWQVECVGVVIHDITALSIAGDKVFSDAGDDTPDDTPDEQVGDDAGNAEFE